jgi:hypothetical protein
MELIDEDSQQGNVPSGDTDHDDRFPGKIKRAWRTARRTQPKTRKNFLALPVAALVRWLRKKSPFASLGGEIAVARSCQYGPDAERPGARPFRGPVPVTRSRMGAVRRLLLGGLLFLGAGCSGSNNVSPPALSPGEAAGQALAEYDANKDGVLDEKELEKCPALKGALKKIDKNNDGRLSADEIAERLQLFQRQGVLTSARVEVTLDGSPLGQATVTLVPEKFMGPAFKPASAVTDASGTVPLQVEGAYKGLVPMGYYRVEVSKKNAGGQEAIPSRFNTQTILGQEVAPEGEERGGGGTIKLRLTSR